MNLVLDETIEFLRGIFRIIYYVVHSNCADPTTDRYTGKTRNLGLVVSKSTSILTINPEEGCEEIENPFQQ